MASVEAACIACAATLAVVSPDETSILWKLNDRSATTANSVAASEKRRAAGPVIMLFCTKPRLLSSHEHVLVISSRWRGTPSNFRSWVRRKRRKRP